MNKKLLAVAVAGALSAPVVAFAQSSVTISGTIKMSLQGFKISNAAAARAGLNTSQTLVHDDSSRILFNVTEDLGGGLQAIAQIDWRVTPDAGSDAITGNNHIGLRSKQWGRIFFGRQDLHYFGRELDLIARNDLQADQVALTAFIGGAGMASLGLQSAGTAAAIGGATRTPNVVHYTTPNWGGFYANIAYSFSPFNASEADINSSIRKGYAWNFNPVFEGRNFTIGYSYWSSKADGTSVAANQRGDHLFGSYSWGGFRIGAVWDKSKVTNEGGLINAVTGSSTVGRRDVWSIPIQYTWGPHWIGGHYTKANDDKATSNISDGAKMWAIGYNYSLSKRTSVGLTYAQITNQTGAIYTLFTSNGALGGGAPHQSLAGEDPKMWSMTIRHAF